MSKSCSNNGCGKSGDHLCSKCEGAQYCSKECQKEHWSIHSASCYQKTADNKVQMDSLSIKQLKYLLKMKASSLSEKEGKILREKEAELIEKPPLAALVESSMTHGEMKRFLAAYAQEKAAPAQSSSMRRSSSSSSSSSRRNSQDKQLEDLKRATPDQLRAQARMFRGNPDAIRRSNPQLAHMSNAELIASAEQMEMMANNPDMLRDAIAQMERMTPEERAMAANITPEQREALNNLTPAQKAQMQKLNALSPVQRTHMMRFQEGLNGTIDENWTLAVLELMKNKGEAFKIMVKSMFEGPDDQVDPWIEFVANMDEWGIRLICRALGIVQSIGRPLAKGYAVVDSYTFGMAKHIALLIAGICLYYSLLWTWAVLRYIFLAVYSLFQSSKSTGSPGLDASKSSPSSSVPNAGMDAKTQSPMDATVEALRRFAADNAGNDEFEF